MKAMLPSRPSSGHKGIFGTVAIIGGSISKENVMLGSPIFAAQAAIRSGAGLITFVGKKELLIYLIRQVPQAVGIIPDGKLNREAGKWQAIVAGPGMGMRPTNKKLLADILALGKPTVIDADALNTIAKYPELFEKIHSLCVLTPHPKEFERLAKALSISSPERMSAKLNCTVVLKSHKTKVISPGREWTEKYENPALATGGTGDVLAGLIGGLLAQYCPDRLTAFECAKLGVAIHSQAAKQWQTVHGSAGLIIEELLGLIPETVQKMRTGED